MSNVNKKNNTGNMRLMKTQIQFVLIVMPVHRSSWERRNVQTEPCTFPMLGNDQTTLATRAFTCCQIEIVLHSKLGPSLLSTQM